MKMNKHYNELKASYLFVDIAHKVAAYQEAHPCLLYTSDAADE